MLKFLCQIRGAALLVLLLTAIVSAQTQQPVTETSRTGSIRGKVVNESGEPLPNALVSIQAIGGTRPTPPTTTDGEGNFRVSDLEAVGYRIHATMPAYISSLNETGEASPKEYKIGDSVMLVLIKGGVMTGTVTTATGDPVIAVNVSARMIRDGKGRQLPRGFAKDGSTDDRGVYRIYGLPTGTYIVVAGSSSQNHSWFGVNPSPYIHDIPTYATSATRETAAEISVRTGEETSNVDIRYRGEKGRTISGSPSGFQNERGFTVYLTSITPSGSQSNVSQFEQPGVREFAFNAVTDGDYFLTLLVQSDKGELGLSESKLIKLRGADVDGIELTPRLMGVVSGRVVLEESKASECRGKDPPAFKDILVGAWHQETEDAKNQPQFIWNYGQPVSPDPTGNISLKNLASGQYNFQARFPARSWYLQSISFAPAAGGKVAKPTDATRIWTTIKPEDRLTGLTVTLAQGGVSFSGQLVLNEGETPSEKWFVYLIPAEQERAGDLLRFYGGELKPDRKIQLFNVAPGRYWVLAQPAIDGVASPLTKFRLPDGAETRLKLRRDAEAAKTEVELKPCQDVVDFKLTLKTSGP